MSKGSIAAWRANFFAGLAVVLPAVVSISILVLLFGTVANITDTLLFFLPRSWTHKAGGDGPIYWYWSCAALLWAILLTSLIGRFARYYMGQRLIELMDLTLLRVPLLNKIYSTLKQVNEAFSPHNKSAFRQVVMIEFPRAGMHSIGFITSEQNSEIQAKTAEKVVGVFVPTTPNPTSGFLVLVPEHSVTRLDMSVADGIKFIISLGAVAPEFAAQPPVQLPPSAGKKA